ncbi:hypothetical protein ACFO4L_13410 [Bacillus daqingensis]|uniref:Uncharacterized protein n=1 Tax=Bacillus daqingensis TaxID=872396 RepID=A0ABV9NZX0_9BACI
MEQARANHHQAFQADWQLPNWRISTPGGSERGEDPADSRRKRLAEAVPSGKRVSVDAGRCNVIHLK